jgi:tRNA G18 (ribose-2'-O)-methylase SpoU
LFVAEGRWVVQRLLARPQFVTQSVLVTPPAFAALFAESGEPANVPVYVVAQDVMEQVAGFNIHRGCLALARRPAVTWLDDQVLRAARRVLVLEGVNNPDNIGGLFRSAAAFDVDLVVLGPACGDPLYRKAIRTSMASTLDVPYVYAGDWPGDIARIASAGLHVVALTPAADAVPLDAVNPEPRMALLLGTEGAGLSTSALNLAHQRVRIATTDRVDSLNVTVAASIALHHLRSGT